MSSELDNVAAAFHAGLDLAAVGYLRGRGIEKRTAVEYQLGVVSGVLSPEWEQYRGRITIPYLNASGVQDIRFRAPDPVTQPKYLSRSGGAPLLFNSRVLTGGGELLVMCEGEFDSMMVWQATGLLPTVRPLPDLPA